MSTVTFDSSAGPRAIVVADEGAAGRSHLDHAMAALARAGITLALTIDAGGDRHPSFSVSPADLQRIAQLRPTARQFEALRDVLAATNDGHPIGNRLTADQLNEGAARLLARLGQLDGHLGSLREAAVSLRIGVGDAHRERPDDTLVIRGDQRHSIRTAPVIISSAPTIERPASTATTAPERSAPVVIAPLAVARGFSEMLRLADAGTVVQLDGGSTMAWLDPSQVAVLREFAALCQLDNLNTLAADPRQSARLLQLLTRALDGAGMGTQSETIARLFLSGRMTVGEETAASATPPAAINPLAALPAPMRAAVTQLQSQLSDLRSHRALFPEAATESVLEAGDALLAAVAHGTTPTAEQLRALRDALVALDSRVGGVTGLAAHPRLETGIRQLDTMLADTSATVRHFPQSFGAMLLDILLEILTFGFANTRFGDGAVARPRWQQAGRTLAANGGDATRSHVAPPALRSAAVAWLQNQVETANPWMSQHPSEALRAAETMYGAMALEYRRSSTGGAVASAVASAPTTTVGAPTATASSATGDARPVPLSEAQRTELQGVRPLLEMGAPAALAPLDALLGANPPTIAHARAFAAAIHDFRDSRPSDYARLLRGIVSAGGTLAPDDATWLTSH